ncbi:MAG: hypothetical protein JXR96_29400 [Deltaproteobacteria bacterium]|nr:hypothetical protein [Deltaproteobacteria bacterium]
MRRMTPVAIALAACGALGCSQSVDEGSQDGGTRSVEVSYGEQAQAIDLGTLQTVQVGGQDLVALDAIVGAAWPELALAAIEADFAAGDGFRPASKSNCAELIPLAGEQLERGYADPQTANLSWDEELGYPGCLHISGLARIELQDAGTVGRKLRVVLGEHTAEIDLSFQPTEDVGGEQLVALDGAVSASGATDSPGLYAYDFEGADGFRPVEDRGYEPLAWESLASGWIHPVTGDLSWDAALDLPGAWSVHDTAAVHLSPVEQPAGRVTVQHGQDEVEVDLGTLETVNVEGEELVKLKVVVQAASLVADPSAFGYDFEGSDGFRPTEDRGAEPMEWAKMDQGYIHPVSRNLSWDAELGLSGWWSVSDTARVHVLDNE